MCRSGVPDRRPASYHRGAGLWAPRAGWALSSWHGYGSLAFLRSPYAIRSAHFASHLALTTSLVVLLAGCTSFMNYGYRPSDGHISATTLGQFAATWVSS